MERAAFFQRQRIDAAGYTAVDLQKILITLMFITFLQVLFGGFGFIGSLLYTGLLFMGFVGASKRKRAHLKFYAIVQSVLVAISVVALLAAVIGLFGYSVAHHEQFVSQYNSLLSQTHISSAAFITLVVASTLYQICLWWLQIRSIVLANKMVGQLDELPYLEQDQLELGASDDESESETSSAVVIPVTPMPDIAHTPVPQAPVYVMPSYMPAPQMDQIYATQFQAPVYYVDQYGRPIQPVYPPQQ
jgi:hypothetical protein